MENEPKKRIYNSWTYSAISKTEVWTECAAESKEDYKRRIESKGAFVSGRIFRKKSR